MCTDDGKVCSRDLEKGNGSPTPKALMTWMTVEMKSCMLAATPIRANSGHRRAMVTAASSLDMNVGSV